MFEVAKMSIKNIYSLKVSISEFGNIWESMKVTFDWIWRLVLYESKPYFMPWMLRPYKTFCSKCLIELTQDGTLYVSSMC